jgi:hypothetical protein
MKTKICIAIERIGKYRCDCISASAPVSNQLCLQLLFYPLMSECFKKLYIQDLHIEQWEFLFARMLECKADSWVLQATE